MELNLIKKYKCDWESSREVENWWRKRRKHLTVCLYSLRSIDFSFLSFPSNTDTLYYFAPLGAPHPPTGSSPVALATSRFAYCSLREDQDTKSRIKPLHLR